MKQTNALRRMLTDMTAVYNSGEKTEVAFTTDTPHASEDARCGCDASGQHVAVNTNVRDTYGKTLDGANELRVLVDTLNHEMEHIRSSPLTAKKEFSQEYPESPQFAGMVLNVLEDQFIDWQRLQRFRGLRGAHSYKVDTIMANGSRRPPLYNLSQSEQVAEGFLQMAFAGYVKGFSDVPDEVQQAIVKCRPLVDAVRNEHDPQEREAIAHQCMELLLEAVPEPDEADEYTDENAEQMPTDEPADLSEQEKQDLLDDLEPEDLAEDGQQGATVEIDPEEHDVPEWLEDEMEPAEGGSSTQEQEAEDGQQEGDSAAQEMGEGEAPEQEEQPDAGDQGESEGTDSAPEGDQEGEAQEGGDDTEGSAGQQGDQGESEGQAGSESSGQDDPTSEVGGDGERSEDATSGGADPQPSEGSEGGDETPQEVQDAIEDLEKKERQREAGEHWDAGDQDYSQADDEFQRRYRTIQQEVQQEQTELGQQKRRRSQRIEDHAQRSGYERRKDSHEKIRELLREDGTAQDIVDAFKKFKTQDRWLPDTRGERLNTRNATRRLAGDYSEDRVYDRKLKAEVGDRVVGVAMDLSGSMSDYNNLRKPKLALGALHLATQTIGDDLLATGYKTYKNHPQKGEYEPVLDLITGPQEGFDWEHLDGAKAGMYTPTADGVKYTMDLLQKSHRREKVLVVITDGKANIPLGGGSSTNSTTGKEDASAAVNTARQNGMRVLGLAVGRVGENYMDEVFGPGEWTHTDSDSLTEDLVELYEGQMRTGGQRQA